MMAWRDNPRRRQTAQAHAAHECPQQHTHRERCRADYQLQQLKPDDLIDQGSRTAAGEQHNQKRKGAVALANYQNKYFIANWRILGSSALRILPKLAELRFVSMAPG